jgi:uncharacterized protein YeaO (DUF488 family)
MPQVQVRRVYDAPEASDGRRVLVDRLWPRGLTKAAAHVDEWLKAVAPSDELRRWYGHAPARYEEFLRRYGNELQEPERARALLQLRELAATGPVTLLTASGDLEHSQAAELAARLRRFRETAAASAVRDRGGDPVCWLPLVCPQCGSMTSGEPPACPQCQYRVPGS